MTKKEISSFLIFQGEFMTSKINALDEIKSLKNKGLTDEKIINDLIALKEKHPELLKKKLTCEMYDKVNLMCRNYMDRMARFEVDYDFIIDEEAFKNVAICCLECAPFMHSKVINSPLSPYWKVCDYHIDQMISFQEVEDIDKARMDFFSKEIPLSAGCHGKVLSQSPHSAYPKENKAHSFQTEPLRSRR